MLGDTSRSPGQTDPSAWKSRSLRIQASSTIDSHFLAAVSLALRFHHRIGTLAVSIYEGLQSHEQVLLPEFGQMSSKRRIPQPSAPVHRPALVISRDHVTNPFQLAASLDAPAILVLTHDAQGAMLSCYFLDEMIPMTQMGWFVIHVARALCYLDRHEDWTVLPVLQSGYLQEYVFRSTSVDPVRRYGLYTPPSTPSSRDIAHLCAVDGARFDPLATAISFKQPDSGQTRTISYAGLVSAALLVANGMNRDFGVFDAILPDSESPVALAIGILAVFIRGHTLVASGCGYDPPPYEYRGSIPVEALTALHMHALDPDKTLYTEGWEAHHRESRLLFDHISAFPALFYPEIGNQPDPIWNYLSHDQFTLTITAQPRWNDFHGGLDSAPIVRFCSRPLSHYWIESLWETFTHRGIAQFDDGDVQSPRVRDMGITHLVVDTDRMEAGVEMVQSQFGTQEHSKSSGPCILVANNAPPKHVTKLTEFNLRVVMQNRDISTLSRPPGPKVLYRKEGCSMDAEEIMRQIEASSSITYIGAAIVPLPGGLLVKHGRSLNEPEIKNALFVRENTRIPVPDIYLMFVSGDRKYAVMDYIPGRCLQDHWVTLTEEERGSVLGQLKSYFEQLRSLSVPPYQAPGPVHGGRLIGMWMPENGKEPFQSSAELVDWQNRLLAGNGYLDDDRKFVEHPLVFTHGDCSPRNLILDDDGKLWMIDWDRAGWWPDYFESACIASDIGIPGFTVPMGWRQRALSLLPNYDAQYRLLKLIEYPMRRMPWIQ